MLVPHSFGSMERELAEYNPCHNPAGHGGGQFCSGKRTPSAGRGRGPSPYTPVKGSANAAHDMLEQASFFQSGETPGHNIRAVMFRADNGLFDEFRPDRTHTDAAIDGLVDTVFGAGRGRGFVADVAKRMVVDAPAGMGERFKVLVQRVNEDGTPQLEVTWDGDEGTRMVRRFFRDNGQLVVDHHLMNVEDMGQGVAKALLRNSLGTYREIGVSRVVTYANIDVGGYAWARYGFLPNASQEKLDDYVVEAKQRHLDGDMTRAEFEAVREVRSRWRTSADVRYSLWKLSDLRLGNTNVGKKLMVNTDWHGYLDLSDARQMFRFLTYTQALKRRAADDKFDVAAGQPARMRRASWRQRRAVGGVQ